MWKSLTRNKQYFICEWPYYFSMSMLTLFIGVLGTFGNHPEVANGLLSVSLGFYSFACFAYIADKVTPRYLLIKRLSAKNKTFRYAYRSLLILSFILIFAGLILPLLTVYAWAILLVLIVTLTILVALMLYSIESHE